MAELDQEVKNGLDAMVDYCKLVRPILNNAVRQ